MEDTQVVAEKLWKLTERMVAKFFGGKRVPITGRIRGSAPDIQHDWLSLEVKHRQDGVPKWLADAMNQAEASNLLGTKLPMVVIHGKGERHEDNLCVIRASDFKDWYL